MTQTILPQPLTAFCSTVHRHYTTTDYQIQEVNNHVWAWCKCPYCDHYRRTKDDPQFDAAHPQPHLMEVKANA